MKHLINPKTNNIQPSMIRKVSDKVAQYNNAINLTVGQPDFNTPDHIKMAGIQAIEKNHTNYTSNAGILELRYAATKFMEEKYQLSYNPETEVLVTAGATGALDIAFRTILTEGCEVLLPAPIYPGYEPLIKLAGAVPVYIDTTVNNFILTVDMIKEKMTDKTRCIVLSFPSNPVGSILNKEQLIEIAELLREKDIFILSDEIYSELTYGKQHTSIASLKGMKEKTIIVNGLSKSHSMTGWRIGLLFAPEYLTSEIFKVHQYSTTCTCSVSQHAAAEALTIGINDAGGMKKEYEKRINFVYERLTKMGLSVLKPEGAFYIFPSIKSLNISSLEFVDQLLEKMNVAVVPGVAFSEYGEGYIRISCAASFENLQEAMNRMEAFVKEITTQKIV
ncbi:aminotransferase A [Niallia sp. 01092]|uniref:aminotransferase A n=1 Tax=unclassified Niallia TaxID=2837522 RepID=UPI003FD1CAF6